MTEQPGAPASPVAEKESDIQVEVVKAPEDFPGLYACCAAAFGTQINEPIWTGMNPGWNTPEGKARGAERLAARWRAATRDHKGDANLIFLKATVPSPAGGSQRVIAGLGTWSQMSVVEGRGTAPPEDEVMRTRIQGLYPDDEAESRCMHQMMRSLTRRRAEIVREKATADPPSVMVLETCAVDPAFQRRGIAAKLVQWGLDEAKRRGGLEALTEASPMGKPVYTRLGFHPEGDGDYISYDVDSEFAGRRTPNNVFLRTGA